MDLMSLIIMLTSLMFMFTYHPLSMGGLIITQAFLTSMITGMLNYNFWFSYIMFLIMVGSLLILFMYMTSIASNEKFQMSYNLIFGILILCSMISMIYFKTKKMLKNINIKLEETEPLMSPIINNLSSMKYFNNPNVMIYWMMIIYLLIAMIMVVKITQVSAGPLQQKF